MKGRDSVKALLLILPVIAVVSFSLFGATVNGQGMSGTATPTAAMPAQTTPLSSMTSGEESWLLLPTFPASATQADVGEEIYRLVCKACHGDLGQGLTEDWIATWNPEDQNCWQSKCHGVNHPPDGFDLPRYVPPVIGEGALARFQTAEELYRYSHDKMPWHNPASMLEEEYWQVTAYILRENDIDSGETLLDSKRAATIRLHPAPAPTATGEAAQGAARSTANGNGWAWPWLAAAALMAAAIIVAVILALRRLAGRNQGAQ